MTETDSKYNGKNVNNINKKCQYLKKTVTDILWGDMKKKDLNNDE